MSAVMIASFCAPATPARARPNAAAAIVVMRFIAVLLLRVCSEMRNGSIPALMGKRPEPQLFLGDLPQAGETVRLDDQEKDDQAAEDDGFGIRDHGVRHLHAERVLQPLGSKIEEDRKQGD